MQQMLEICWSFETIGYAMDRSNPTDIVPMAMDSDNTWHVAKDGDHVVLPERFNAYVNAKQWQVTLPPDLAASRTIQRLKTAIRVQRDGTMDGHNSVALFLRGQTQYDVMFVCQQCNAIVSFPLKTSEGKPWAVVRRLTASCGVCGKQQSLGKMTVVVVCE